MWAAEGNPVTMSSQWKTRHGYYRWHSSEKVIGHTFERITFASKKALVTAVVNWKTQKSAPFKLDTGHCGGTFLTQESHLSQKYTMPEKLCPGRLLPTSLCLYPPTPRLRQSGLLCDTQSLAGSNGLSPTFSKLVCWETKFYPNTLSPQKKGQWNIEAGLLGLGLGLSHRTWS